ncbi:MAG: alpha/beta fold hydrolase [Pseudomonadota bacterium]
MSDTQPAAAGAGGAATDDKTADVDAASAGASADDGLASDDLASDLDPISPHAPRSTELRVRGRRVGVRRYGDADAQTAVLAAHGWGGQGSDAHGGRWAALANALGPRFGLIAPDLPGYGASDPAIEDDNPVFTHDAAVLSEIIVAAKPALHLIGAGFGAEAATRAALRHPEKTASLTLIDPPAFALLEEAGDPRRLEAQDIGLAALSLTAHGGAEEAARLLTNFWRGPDAFDALSEEARAYAIACAPRAAAEWRAMSLRTPGALRFEDYQRLQTPMLVVTGPGAPASVRAAAARIRRAAPTARAVEARSPTGATANPTAATDEAALTFLIRQNAPPR